MQDFLLQQGYPALFTLSFLASTLLPLGSEWLLAAMVVGERDPVTAVAIASAGNYLGACTTYAVGIWGGPFLIGKILRIGDRERSRAEQFYTRYGPWSLLLSWLPVIGDPLCLTGGIFRIPFLKFSLLVLAGKIGRYAAIAWVTVQGVSHA